MKHLLPLFALCLILLGCAPQESKTASPQHNADAEALLTKLASIAAEGKTMYGHQDDLMYGHTWRIGPDETAYDRSDIKMVCGDFPAVVGFDLGGIELGDERNLDGNVFAQIKAAALAHYARGGIVTYSWHPRNPLTGGDAWDVSSKEVVASILEGGANHEKFMGWLKNLADFIASVQTADGKKIPAIFRPWHEHTGSWFWWGRNLCTVEQYKDLWAMTYNYLVKERGLDNLLWAYSPNTGVMYDGFMERYPGDGYVDIIGFDCYSSLAPGRKKHSDFRNSIRYGLGMVTMACERHHKVPALTETGIEGIEFDKWWTNALYKGIDGFNIAYLLTWRNAPDRPEHYFGVFPGQASADDFNDFCKLDKILNLNDIR